jgi:hypothetical protein
MNRREALLFMPLRSAYRACNRALPRRLSVRDALSTASRYFASKSTSGEINEFAFAEVPWRADLTVPPERFDKGRLTVSERAGFGITLNEKIIRQFARSS